ncbi:bacillithiol biosynthesis deacetylase BshB2, partial [Desertibacillus haloalkaliphilus]|nr:bacillithiol biosynthesis deacetylase BshB2 [Desertibacillus haloalkaliphilus]
VITFYPGYSVHPDHEATAHAVIEAVKRMEESERPTVHCVAFSNGHEQEIGPADIVNDITPFAEQKKAAMRAHLSQTEWMLKELEPKWESGDKVALEWLQTERFWTYSFK